MGAVADSAAERAARGLRSLIQRSGREWTRTGDAATLNHPGHAVLTCRVVCPMPKNDRKCPLQRYCADTAAIEAGMSSDARLERRLLGRKKNSKHLLQFVSVHIHRHAEK